MTKQQHIEIELSAVIVLVTDGSPRIVLARTKAGPALPSGPLQTEHKKLEQALRGWVSTETGLSLGYVEQLYTFADKDRDASGRRVISIGYVALTRDQDVRGGHDIEPMDWYSFFPWEDHRNGTPDKILSVIRARLNTWKNAAPDRGSKAARQARIEITFPTNPKAWNEELVLQRYELLWEAGLIEEAVRAGKQGAAAIAAGQAMTFDHRRILATAIARLRAKIKYRPVVFELMPPTFTLLQLQQTVEALAGLRLHKQNFRRLILSQGLVEETQKSLTPAKGRPAQLFAFRREILRERAIAGTKLPRG
ncbi:MAG: hypothetical protein EOM37_06660 [Proteobacteria bacterium]|nr:hypothetical protein [Pseudomonadota bacterium]